jgi:hypothetical protein
MSEQGCVIFERTFKVKTKTRKTQMHRVSINPTHEKLPWPGLRDKEHLTRFVTRMVKEEREARELNAWAENQIARILDLVPPEVAVRLVLCEMSRRGTSIPISANAALKLLGPQL